jgi:phospholipid/cholesterol/gamma-HCH transport system substrate-binding protein
VVIRYLKFFGFIAVSLAFTILFALQILQLQGGDRYQMAAYFDDVTGLFKGDDVKLAGVQVGKVSGISLEDGRARVTFRIDSDVTLPTDSDVAVRWRNLIGQRYLYLYEGDADEMLPKDGSVQFGSDEYPEAEAIEVTDITDLVNTIGPLAGSIDAQKVNEVFGALVEALQGNEENLPALLIDLNGVLDVLAERSATFGQLLTDYATISDELATRDGQIETMIDNLVLLSQTFADNTSLVDNALTELAGFTGDLNTVLTTNEGHLASIIANLSVVTDTATGRLDELEQALRNLPEGLRELFSLSDEGHYLNANIPCFQASAPPCLTPSTLGVASAAPTAHRLDSGSALSNLLLGGLGGQR